jgi:hypothetical protein
MTRQTITIIHKQTNKRNFRLPILPKEKKKKPKKHSHNSNNPPRNTQQLTRLHKRLGQQTRLGLDIRRGVLPQDAVELAVRHRQRDGAPLVGNARVPADVERPVGVLYEFFDVMSVETIIG